MSLPVIALLVTLVLYAPLTLTTVPGIMSNPVFINIIKVALCYFMWITLFSKWYETKKIAVVQLHRSKNRIRDIRPNDPAPAPAPMEILGNACKSSTRIKKLKTKGPYLGDSIFHIFFSSPCSNGATCLDQLGGFHCVCPTGYTDPICSTDIDECAFGLCLNGASCTDGVADFTCACDVGYEGTLCETNTDDCARWV